METSAQSNIFVPAGTPRPSGPPPLPKNKLLTARNIFIFLGIIIAAELVYGLFLINRQSATTSNNTPADIPGGGGILNLPVAPEVGKGVLVLLADKKEVQIGEIVSVSVQVNSPAVTEGVDVVAKFDPALLSAIDGDVHPGTIFSRYPLASVDPAGIVRISGIATPGTIGFSGKDIFAIVNFKALEKGVAKITLDFTPGSTADSNIVDSESSKDLLEEVGNLEITIK